MRILLTNDDGINAPGLAALCQELNKIATVSVFAPTYERSATSHGITVRAPLRVQEEKMEGAAEAWAIDGFPVDCVKLALQYMMKDEPDLVISGINHGANLGTDTLYSGTVSAALEGYICGFPSIAVSLIDGKSNLEKACQFITEFCLWWQKENFKPCCTFNINVPPGEIKGCKYAQLGVRTYHNVFEERIDPRGGRYFWLSGQPEDKGCGGRSDVEIVADGCISITPLGPDLTDYKILAFIKENPPLT
jgi:5'-nucleotidase